MKKKTRVLAIDPGTRYIGFALLEGKALIHYGVKTIDDGKSAEGKLKEGKGTILRLLGDFRPNVLTIEQTYFAKNKSARLLNKFVREIISLGRKKRLRVTVIATNTVRKQICGNGAAGKDDVARVLVGQYPELLPYLTSDKRWKELYFRNMFDAVAVGGVR